MSLAQRRADKRRMKAKARRIYPQDTAGKMADHLAFCSRWCCGNPRKHYGELRMYERRALDVAKSQQVTA